MSYDRADYDYSTEDAPLPKGHAATHIGIFLSWAAFNGLLNEFHEKHSTEALAKLRRREITGRLPCAIVHAWRKICTKIL